MADARPPMPSRHRRSPAGTTASASGCAWKACASGSARPIALGGVDLAVNARRGARAGRRERRGQEHADEGALRRAPAGRRADVARRPALRAAQPARRPPGRRGDDLPGAVARAAPVGDGEHPARHGADARAAGALGRGPPPRRGGAGDSSAAATSRSTCRSRELSIASQQMVEIARAVAIGCRVLVLDEPTSSLTRPDIRQLFDLVRRLRSQGLAIVYISHFLEEVKEISDRFTVLRDGRAVGGGATRGRDAGADHRDDGRPRRRGPVPALAAHAGRGRARRRTTSPARRQAASRDAAAAPRRSARHRRPDRRGPHRAAPRASSASTPSAAGDVRVAAYSGHALARARAGGRAWAWSARTARPRGSRSTSASPTT